VYLKTVIHLLLEINSGTIENRQRIMVSNNKRLLNEENFGKS
jgi:hypothetical protein